MNKVILIGRLTKDVEMNNGVGKYSLAVDRKFKKDGEPTADFINCTVFGKSAEFAQKYFKKGTKIAVVGRIQTGSYTNKDGVKVYTTDVIVEEQEFAESKATSGNANNTTSQNVNANASATDTFMNVPDGLDSEELPFA